MLEMQVSRTEAQKIYTVVHNVEATTVSVGMGIRYVGGAANEIASADGVGVKKVSARTDMGRLAGIAERDVPSDGYGRVQCWGYVDSILISAIANTTAAPGDMFKPGGVAGTFTKDTLAVNLSTLTEDTVRELAFNVEAFNTTNVSGGLPYASGFIRAI